MDAPLRADAAGLITCGLACCTAPAPIFLAMMLADLATTGISGKSLEDRSLDILTGEDCNAMTAAFESDSTPCEPTGSPATRHDFSGLIGMARYERGHHGGDQVRTDPDGAPAALNKSGVGSLVCIRRLRKTESPSPWAIRKHPDRFAAARRAMTKALTQPRDRQSRETTIPSDGSPPPSTLGQASRE